MTETNFKHTDLGLIPHDWEVKSIKETAPLQRGFDLPKKEQKDGIYPVVYSNGICSYHDKYMVNGPGVVTGRSGTIGNIHYVESNYWPHNTSLWVTTFNGNFPKFIYYLFCTFDWKQFAAGSGVPSLNRNSVHEKRLAFPPTIAEQERIAGALSSIDILIGALTEQIEKKRHIKQGAMQQLLTGKKRLAGFIGEWITETIKDVCDRYDHLRVPVAANLRTKGLTPYYGANGIQDYVDGYTHDGEFILLAEDGANNLVDYPIQYVSGRIWVNNHAHVLSAKEKKANNRFLAYVLKTIDFESNIVGSGRAKLNAETLMQLEITIPPTIAEQSAIATVLSRMDTEIAALEQKRDKYIAIKSGMMQNLLTGKIRLA